MGNVSVVNPVIKAIFIGVSSIAALAIFTHVAVCPCGPIPGMRLSGTEVVEPVEDWSFANHVELCQIQVQTWKPHALNLNCYSNDSELFVSCSDCAEKSWSGYATNAPGRVKIGKRVYAVMFSRVTEADELDRSWSSRLEKLKKQDDPRPEDWWSFQLTQIASPR